MHHKKDKISSNGSIYSRAEIENGIILKSKKDLHSYNGSVYWREGHDTGKNSWVFSKDGYSKSPVKKYSSSRRKHHIIDDDPYTISENSIPIPRSRLDEENMKVNFLYKGMIYRVKGFKILCSILSGILILLLAAVILGAWIVLGASENGEIYFPWKKIANKSLKVDSYNRSSPSTEHLENMNEKLISKNYLKDYGKSMEAEDAMRYLKYLEAEAPPEKEKNPEETSNYDNYYENYDDKFYEDLLREYSLLRPAIVKPPKEFKYSSSDYYENTNDEFDEKEYYLAKFYENNPSLELQNKRTEIRHYQNERLPKEKFLSTGRPKDKNILKEDFTRKILSANENNYAGLLENKFESEVNFGDLESFDNIMEYDGILIRNQDENKNQSKNEINEGEMGSPNDMSAPSDSQEVNEALLSRRTKKIRKIIELNPYEHNSPEVNGKNIKFQNQMHRSILSKPQTYPNVRLASGINNGIPLINHEALKAIPVRSLVHPIPNVRRSHIEFGNFNNFPSNIGPIPGFEKENSSKFRVQLNTRAPLRIPSPPANYHLNNRQYSPRAQRRISNNGLKMNNLQLPTPSYLKTNIASTSRTVKARRNNPGLHRVPVNPYPTISVKNMEESIMNALNNMYDYSKKIASYLIHSPEDENEGRTTQTSMDFLKNSFGLLHDFDDVFSSLPKKFLAPFNKFQITSPEELANLNPFQLSLVTWTIIDFWDFLIEKVGKLSKHDLRTLEFRLANIRQMKDSKIARSMIESNDVSFHINRTQENTNDKLLTKDKMHQNSTSAFSNISKSSSKPNNDNSELMAHSVKALFNFGKVYMKTDYALECTLLLFCKDINSNTRNRGMEGLAAKLKSVGLKVLVDREGREADTVSSMWQALTNWAPLECDAMFPKCDGSKALEIVNEVANASR